MSSQLLDLGRENARLKQEAVRLREALEESVKLQGHYAELLNMYDGGSRIVFLSATDWMARLAMTTVTPCKDQVFFKRVGGG